MAKTLPVGNQSGLGELISRIKFVFLAILVYRIGAHIPVPGINPDALARLFQQNEGTILGLFNMFSGGALERMSVLALGIMPYISASIIIQLMTVVSPQLEQLKKEGESGRRKISQYTRYLTVCPGVRSRYGYDRRSGQPGRRLQSRLQLLSGSCSDLRNRCRLYDVAG